MAQRSGSSAMKRPTNFSAAAIARRIGFPKRCSVVRAETRVRSAVALALVLSCAALDGQTGKGDGEWRAYGRDPGGSRFSPLAQITRDNVGGLAEAWVYRHGEPVPEAGREGPAFESTPLVIDGFLYFTSPSGRVIALDAETGAERWTFDPKLARPAGSGRHRGVAYWERGRDRRIFVGTLDGRLIALDALTGKLKEAFGDNGQIRLDPGLSLRSPPAIFKDLVITGAAAPEFPGTGPAGDVRAFDARNGRLVWTFHTVPRESEPGHDTWDGDSWRDRTGANVWSMMAVDAARGLVFLPIGSASYDFYGGDRKGQNLYANCVVALEAATGRVRWHFQTVHHDLWDYDVPAQPVLVTVRHDGRRVDAVAQVSKTGFIYLLDRETGRPLFPIEERPVPASQVPGEAAWPTQPFPVKPLPLARTAPLTRDQLSAVTPEARRYCEALFDRVVSGGIFTPHGEALTLVFPGNLGGATWSGAAFDPSSGYLFVNVNELGAVGEMRKSAGPIAYRRGSDLPRGEYARFWDEHRWPCQAPPWGTLNAVNLHDGSIAWRVPLGIVGALAAKGLSNTGTPNLGGAIVTASGLVFIAGTNDSRMRAFDARTGATLWDVELPASGHATPITYLGPRSGRQFVAIAAGGGGYLSPTYSDALVAFSLPRSAPANPAATR
jgi:glucose dehydrogenase